MDEPEAAAGAMQQPARLPRAGIVRWRACSLLTYVLLLLIAGMFLYRGPLRAIQSSAEFNDFLAPYIQTRAWIRGADPYSPQSLLEFWPPANPAPNWLRHEVANGTLLIQRGIPTAYLPSSFPVLLPIALLPWPAAYVLWTVLSVILFGIMVASLTSLSGMSGNRRSFFVAGALALAPFHTGIATGNPAVLATELAVISLWMAHAEYAAAAGIMIALSCCLKPQIGLCFALLYLLQKRKRLVGTVITLGGTLTLLSVAWMMLSPGTWWQSYRQDNHALFATGVLSDFGPRNPTRYGLINLQVLLDPILKTRSATNAAALSISAILFVTWLSFVLRHKRGQPDLLAVSGLVVLTLLPIYHRFYDAGLLILPFCWVMARYEAILPRRRMVALCLLIPFLLPGGSLLEVLQARGKVPAYVAGGWWWNSLVMPHATWSLLALSLLLLSEFRTGRVASPNLLRAGGG